MEDICLFVCLLCLLLFFLGGGGLCGTQSSVSGQVFNRFVIRRPGAYVDPQAIKTNKLTDQ